MHIPTQFPESLPYPLIASLKNVPQLNDKFCYIIKAYPMRGIGIMILRNDGQVFIRLSDFSGMILDVNVLGSDEKIIEKIMTQYSNKLVNTMIYSHIKQAMFYFSFHEEPLLVDMRVSINKFCGPGWLYDFFDKQGIPTQQRIGQPLHLTKENIEMITSGKGDYTHELIIKPSAFKYMEHDGKIIPIYGKVP